MACPLKTLRIGADSKAGVVIFFTALFQLVLRDLVLSYFL